MSNKYGFPSTITDATVIGGTAFRRLFGVLNTQLAAALGRQGPGVVSGLQVSGAGGLSLSVGAGSAIALLSAGGIGYVALESAGDTIDLPGDTETGDIWYIFAAIELAEVANAPDSREDAHINFVVQSGDTLDGAVKLAKVTVTDDDPTILDQRNLLDNSSLLSELIDNGRIVGTDFTAGAPALPALSALSLVLPSGGRWLIQNQLYPLNADVTIDTVPPSGTFYGFLSVDPDSDEPTVLETDWYSTFPTGGTLAALVEAGKPCLGKVTASDTATTAIDATSATGHADLIYTQAGLLTLMGSGGESGPAYWDPLTKSSSDTTTIQQAIDAKVAALKAELLDTISAGGARPQTTPLDALMHKLAIVSDSVVSLKPDDGERMEDAMVVHYDVDGGGLYGDGTDSYPDFIDTELEFDPGTGEILT